MDNSLFVVNWVDLLIILILFFYLLQGLQEGFLSLTASLFSFLASFVVAFRFYPLAGQLLNNSFSLPYGLAKALGFLLLAMVVEAVLGTVASVLLRRLPSSLVATRWNKLLGVFPALLDGLVIVAFILVLLTALPLPSKVKKEVASSQFGNPVLSQTVALESRFKEVFGGAAEEALTFLTIKTEPGQRVDLHFKAEASVVDEAAEAKMLFLVNRERALRGLKRFEWAPELVPVARAHSKDMFVRGYFAHTSPEGKNVADRLKDRNLSFYVVGENLALSPTVDIAHKGLMNSPGHRANILSKDFSKIGIGVMDGGIYGKMFTQIFVD